MTETSEFEQKLASLKPRLLRDVASEIVVSDKSPEIFTLSAWEDHLHRLKPYFKVGVGCFLLGAIAMYVMLTCFFDRQPGMERPLMAQTSSVSIPVMLDESDLASIRRPFDLTQVMNRKTTEMPKEKVPEPDYTQSRLMREFLP